MELKREHNVGPYYVPCLNRAGMYTASRRSGYWCPKCGKRFNEWQDDGSKCKE